MNNRKFFAKKPSENSNQTDDKVSDSKDERDENEDYFIKKPVDETDIYFSDDELTALESFNSRHVIMDPSSHLLDMEFDVNYFSKEDLGPKFVRANQKKGLIQVNNVKFLYFCF